MTLAKSNTVATKLRNAGFNASAYAKGPAGKDIFIIGNQHATLIKVWVPDHVEPEIHTDKKKKQAVLTVVEPKRKITESHVVRHMHEFNNSENSEEDITRILKGLKGSAFEFQRPRVQIQNAKVKRKVVWTDKKLANQVKYILGELRWRYGDTTRIYFDVPVELTIEAPRSEINLLLGIDESSHFVAMLPKKASSVEEAHEILKPKGLGKDYKRQGEWFFKPAPKRLHATLNALSDGQKISRGYEAKYRIYNDAAATATRDWYRMNQFWDSRGRCRLELESSHTSEFRVEYEGKVYVRGKISDTRSNHHKDLNLEVWHELIRNNEVTLPPENDRHSDVHRQNRQQRRYWD